jgi:hypothetical protein
VRAAASRRKSGGFTTTRAATNTGSATMQLRGLPSLDGIGGGVPGVHGDAVAAGLDALHHAAGAQAPAGPFDQRRRQALRVSQALPSGQVSTPSRSPASSPGA